MASDNKYDRQLRLWGANGQKALMESKICLLNAGPTGTETLKNLVLPGCGFVFIVDGAVVSAADCANNFFMEPSRVGQPRAKAALELLIEMNDDVKGDFRQADPASLVAAEPSFFTQFSLVIATQMCEETLTQLGDLLYRHGIPLLIARTYGLIGYTRTVLAEHRIVESLLDTQVEDLRIAHPFSALRAYVDAIDLSSCDDMVHGHIPYVALLVKAMEAWQAKEGRYGAVPKTFAEKESFKAAIKALSRDSEEANFREALNSYYQAYVGAPGVEAAAAAEMGGDSPATVHAAAARAYLASSDVDLRAVLNDSIVTVPGSLQPSTPPYWFVVAALRQFLFIEGALPVSGSLPDMTATTDLYVSLQRLYQQKAAEDVAEVTSLVNKLTSSVGAPLVSTELIASMCRNARNLRVVRFRSLADELGRGAENGRGGSSGAASSVSCDAAASASAVDPDIISGLRNELEEALEVKQEDLPPLGPQAPVAWYWQLRAVDRFFSWHGRYPGTPLDCGPDVIASDAAEVAATTSQLLTSYGLTADDVKGVVVPEQSQEM